MDSSELKALLAKCGISQRTAAKVLNINERTMRRYCAGGKIPHVVELAMRWIYEGWKHGHTERFEKTVKGCAGSGQKKPSK